LIARYGRPRYVRSDNGPELVVQNLADFLKGQGIQPTRIELGKPWQNGRNESFNGTLHRECLNAEIFLSLSEASVVIEVWRRLYKYARPHSALGYQMSTTMFEGNMNRKT
jgi:putative transposase